MVFLRSEGEPGLRNGSSLLGNSYSGGLKSESWLSNMRNSQIELGSMGSGMGGVGAGSGGGEMLMVRQELTLMRKSIDTLEADRDNLRQAIRKLKVENSRMKLKLKRVATAAGHMEGIDEDDKLALDMDDIDFADVKDFVLIGGPKDPFSLRFEAKITDSNGLEHNSAERYLWYKMAETFGDTDAAERINKAESGAKAEEEMGKIKSFEESAWNVVKMKHWEEGQRLKMEQNRWIQNILVASDKMYIAVSSQDKQWGTGWRKQRVEAGQPRMWDGENEGGKSLMRMRDSFKTNHTWTDDAEKTEATKKYDELKRTFWRRPLKRDSDEFPGPFSIRQASRGGPGGRGRGAPMRGRGNNKRGRY